MKRTLKNCLTIFLCSFFLVSCDFLSFLSDCDHEYIEIKYEPNCTQAGYIKHVCEKCEISYIDNYERPLGHSFVHHDAVKPTITTPGNKEYYTCERCNLLFDKWKRIVNYEDVVDSLEFTSVLNSEDPVYFMHGDLTVDYDKERLDNLFIEIDNTCEKIKNETADVGTIISNINEISTFYSIMYDVSNKATIIAYANSTDKDYAFMDEVDSYFNTVSIKYTQLVLEVCKSKKYRAYVYGNYSDQYYNSIINSYSNSSATAEIEQAINEIKNDYLSGKVSAEKSFSKYVEKANQLAAFYGYENYLEYAYPSVYQREYTVDDTEDFNTYVIDYIVPLFHYIEEKYADLLLNRNSTTQNLNGYINSEKLNNNFFGTSYEYLKSYSEYLGGSYLNNFNNFFVNGSYYFSNIENKNITGFVSSFYNGKPYMFLSKKYQSVSTFIHEFGHYNSALTYGGLGSYDLAEFQSQGNEMLYYSFLSDYLDEYTYKYFIYSNLNSMLGTVVVGYIVNELEKYAYSDSTLTENDLKNKLISLCSSINCDSTRLVEIMYLILMNYNGYYISYATSAVSSLELFATYFKDKNAAKQAYKSVYTKDSNDENFRKSIENADLYWVFDENAYKLIAELSDVF